MRFNEPIRYGEFKQLSNRTKKEYVMFLREKYNVTNAALCHMLGCTFKTLRKQLDSLDADFGFKHGNKMSKEEKAAWDAFLRGEAIDDNETNHEEEHTETPVRVIDGDIHIHRCAGGRDEVIPVSALVAGQPATQERAWVSSQPIKPKPMNMHRMEVDFEGEIHAVDIANYILFAVGDGATAHVKVIVER